MFSNKFRFVKILVLVFILSGLVYYVQNQGPKKIPGIKEFLQSPEIFVNKELEFSGKIKKIDEKSFLVEQKLDGEKVTFDIDGNLENAKLEDQIYGVAVYQQNRTLVLNRYKISNSRPIKIIISLIALIAVVILFLRDFTFDFKKLIFIPKRNF